MFIANKYVLYVKVSESGQNHVEMPVAFEGAKVEVFF